MSEKWFHDLNSQNNFSHHRQNKILKCVHKLFYFPSCGTIHVIFNNFNTVKTVFYVYVGIT